MKHPDGIQVYLTPIGVVGEGRRYIEDPIDHVYKERLKLCYFYINGNTKFEVTVRLGEAFELRGAEAVQVAIRFGERQPLNSVKDVQHPIMPALAGPRHVFSSVKERMRRSHKADEDGEWPLAVKPYGLTSAPLPRAYGGYAERLRHCM